MLELSSICRLYPRPQLVSHTFIIVAITYPKLDSDDELCFREVDRFRCEVPMLSEAHLLSYRRKMMLAISQDSDSSFAILYIVLDWSTGKCFRLNTFEKYVRLLIPFYHVLLRLTYILLVLTLGIREVRDQASSVSGRPMLDIYFNIRSHRDEEIIPSFRY